MDEYQLWLHPVILGEGKPLFKKYAREALPENDYYRNVQFGSLFCYNIKQLKYRRMKKLKFGISIEATKQKVWDTMLHPDTYKEWIAGSWPDSFYVGKWGQDEKIGFISDDGSGTQVLIERLIRYENILQNTLQFLNLVVLQIPKVNLLKPG